MLLCFLYKIVICSASHYRNEELIVICVYIYFLHSAHLSIIERSSHYILVSSCVRFSSSVSCHFHLPYKWCSCFLIVSSFGILFFYLSYLFILVFFLMLSSRIVVVYHFFSICVLHFVSLICCLLSFSVFFFLTYSISLLLSLFVGLHLICLHVTCS